MDIRLALFNKYDNAVCISVHQNQFTDPAYSGAQMFYSDNVKRSGTLAQCLQNAFVTQLQPDNAREIKQCGKELYLCYFSENPTVMVECGFLSNPDEAALLEANPDVILICDEVGCGVVPVEPAQRARREAVGRLCCRLAERAERVERIFCGLPMVLKGEGPWN